MGKGYLTIEIYTADYAIAVPQASVRIYKILEDDSIFELYLMSNDEGKTSKAQLDTVNACLSLNPNNTERPYTDYNIEIRVKGYENEERINVQVFDGQDSSLQVNMIPTLTPNITNIDTIVDHHLLTDYGGHNTSQIPPMNLYVLKSVVIPNKIRVHLGRPTSNAENLTVDFRYYIKNVCSSEVYPTWPYEALKANIWCQISLALNRIYTEWYPSKGYDYDITNSTAFDQAFVKGRTIYDSMAVIVDDIFNEYISKANYAEPFYAEYCDGKIAQCKGLKQWGTLSLANQGYTAINILKYYYGNNIKIVESDRIEDVKSSYPGSPLKLGSSGLEVHTLQEELNAISINFPLIKAIYPVNGLYETSTYNAVKAFQKQFSLTIDGIVGKSTWYQVSYIYVAVRKLAELGSIGKIENTLSGEFAGTTLSVGSKGVDVQQLQFYLSAIAIFYEDIFPITSIDGRFGSSTEKAVVSFQKKYKLIADGKVGLTTWNKIFEIYKSISNEVTPEDAPEVYPGHIFTLGATGDDVATIQSALNIVSSIYPSIHVIVEDAIFGTGTREAVIAFQKIFNLAPDGIVGELTWNKLLTVSNQIQEGERPNLGYPPYPGTLIRIGSRGSDVTFMQQYLNFISIYYKSIGTVLIDGIFGNGMRTNVINFQNLVGISADGIIGEQTWDLVTKVYNELIN
ncbi:MAG: peptidoglycan-binding protein [Erysipelotrichaceae bacterium]